MKRFKRKTILILLIFAVTMLKLHNLYDSIFFQRGHMRNTALSKKHNLLKLQSKDLSFSDNAVQVLTFTNIWTKTNTCSSLNNKFESSLYVKSLLKDKQKNMTIFVHNPNVDGVSRSVASNGEWEPHLDAIIRKYLDSDPGMKLIDIGANIGVKSLKALNFGRRVIAIEPDESNLKLLCKSVAENKFQKNITIVYNIVGDSHFENLQMAVGINGDRTSNFVVDSNELEHLKKKSDGRNFYKTVNKTVPVMKLDDLLQLPEIRNSKGTYFLKIDVEGYEDRVIKGGMRFIRHGGVKGILMEWRWHKKRKTADVILRYMIRLGFEPFTETMNPLLRRTPRYWSDDVLWLPRKLR